MWLCFRCKSAVLSLSHDLRQGCVLDKSVTSALTSTWKEQKASLGRKKARSVDSKQRKHAFELQAGALIQKEKKDSLNVGLWKFSVSQHSFRIEITWITKTA